MSDRAAAAVQEVFSEERELLRHYDYETRVALTEIFRRHIDAEVVARVGELQKTKDENLMFRKILAHVPGRVALKAKEEAGYGSRILLLSTKEDDAHG